MHTDPSYFLLPNSIDMITSMLHKILARMHACVQDHKIGQSQSNCSAGMSHAQAKGAGSQLRTARARSLTALVQACGDTMSQRLQQMLRTRCPPGETLSPTPTSSLCMHRVPMLGPCSKDLQLLAREMNLQGPLYAARVTKAKRLRCVALFEITHAMDCHTKQIMAQICD
jgi:hypothetical protein